MAMRKTTDPSDILAQSIDEYPLQKALYKSQKQSPGVVPLKSIFRNFAKFTGKHLCQSLFFKKVAG